jgi:hypothetical protein
MLPPFLLCPPALAAPSDLTAGELRIGKQDATLRLVLPTGWVAFADDDASGGLSDVEIAAHTDELARRLGTRIWLAAEGRRAHMSVRPAEAPPARLALATDGAHAALEMVFVWPQPVAEVDIHYALFTPGVKDGRGEIAIARDNIHKTLVFTPGATDQRYDGRSWLYRLNVAGLLQALGVALLAAAAAYALRAALTPRGNKDS